MSFLLAYLDPGSGSMLLYAVIGIVTSIFYSLRSFYYRFIHWVTLGKVKDMDKVEHQKIAFHSEGPHYWSLFNPIFKALDEHNIEYLYVTSDPADKGVIDPPPNRTIRAFHNEIKAISFLNNLHANLLISSTPSLDVYMWKKTKKIKNYVHLIHAPTDVAYYEKYAFDFFDTVMCSGPHQIKHLRECEETRKTKKKTIVETGCLYFDNLQERYDNEYKKVLEQKEKGVFTLLFAPTWGMRCTLRYYGLDPIKKLLGNDNFHIIFRPHPQMFKSDKDILDPALEELRKYSNFTLDEDKDNFLSLAKSDALLTDISGVMFDYALLFEKPVILVPTDTDLFGYDMDWLDWGEVWENKLRKEVFFNLKKEDFDNIDKLLLDFKNSGDYIKIIQELKKNSVFNFGHSGKVAAQQIIEMSNSYS